MLSAFFSIILITENPKIRSEPNKMKVFQLPLPVYDIIRDYVTVYIAEPRCQPQFHPEIGYWRNFLSCSKEFEEIKSELNCYLLKELSADAYLRYLNKKLTSEHYLCKPITDLVEKEVKRPWNQIGLVFDIHSRSQQLPAHLSVLSFRVNEFYFSPKCAYIRDISCLRNVKYVALRRCSDIQDLSPLQNCIFVDLSETGSLVNNSNIHLLSKVKILCLQGCESLSEVACLSNVYDLSLVRCKRIKDVSMLGKVHSLDISYCRKIKDISALSSVRRLNIRHMKNIDFGFLSTCCKVQELSVSTSTYFIAVEVEHLCNILYVDSDDEAPNDEDDDDDSEAGNMEEPEEQVDGEDNDNDDVENEENNEEEQQDHEEESGSENQNADDGDN
jgi:hypothetical protein